VSFCSNVSASLPLPGKAASTAVQPDSALRRTPSFLNSALYFNPLLDINSLIEINRCLNAIPKSGLLHPSLFIAERDYRGQKKSETTQIPKENAQFILPKSRN
jgi:hypothetical protein